MTSGPPFQEIVRAHEGVVLKVCQSVLRDEHLASDAAQETFLRLWHTARKGQMPDRPAPWLSRAAATTALDVARRRRVRWRESLEPQERLGEAASKAPAPLDELRCRELADRLAQAEHRLPEQQRTVFQLRHHGGLPLAEVAGLLDVSVSTVKTQFARACLKLQACLADDRPGRE